MNILPIIAGGAALLLLSGKKKKPKSTKTNGNGNGSNGSTEAAATIKEPGLYDIKVNETVTILPTSGEFYLPGRVRVNGDKSEGTPFESGKGYILMENEVQAEHRNKTISLTFRPLKKGTFVLYPTLFTGTAEHHSTDDIEYTFVVS